MGDSKEIDFTKVITLRSILKKIFPRIFLKRAFLFYNALKANTSDRIFFKKEQLPLSRFNVYKEKNPFLFHSIDISKFDLDIRDKLTIWMNPGWTQDQYLLNYQEEGFIEPKVGWGVSKRRKLIYPSLGFSTAPHVHKPDFTEFYFKKEIVSLNSVISLRDTGEENYFHFYNDVLAKLFFLIEHGVSLDDYIIVVSESLFSKQYFQFYLQNSFFSKLKWFVQKHEWIHFNEAIFCKPFTHTKLYFDKAVDLVSREQQTLTSERRIFLNRSQSSLRYIENFSEIEGILVKYKFEIVDASQLSLGLQMELFGQCRYLIAIHGAGITNIIFRRGEPLSLLEIVQPSLPYIPFHYIMVAKLYNYDYDVMLGKRGKQLGDGGFVVDIVEFENKLKQMNGLNL